MSAHTLFCAQSVQQIVGKHCTVLARIVILICVLMRGLSVGRGVCMINFVYSGLDDVPEVPDPFQKRFAFH